jgi:8-oxo-dGTP pyrophosphatase MutT (NUDIX family)
MQIIPTIIDISFKEKHIFLVEVLADISPNLKNQDALILFQLTGIKLKNLIRQLNELTISQAIIVGNIEVNIEQFKQTFSFIRAGGGLVENEYGELLCIFRRGKWDFPKGKLDNGETIEACAMREVTEETGATQLSLDALVLKTFHMYEFNDVVFKQTDWFLMKTNSKYLYPQAEEEIDEAIWLKRNQLDKIISNTYPSIINVLRAAGYLKS